LLALLPWGLFLLAITVRLLPGPRTIDDSYITYRYARNLLAGLGFVYNPGEHVLGTTTPLYTFMMALGGALTGGVEAPFPRIAMLVNALADGGACLLLLWLGKKLRFSYAGWGASLTWAIAPFSVTFAIGGLETSVFVLLLLGSAAAHLAERRILAALLAALALLTRPDALILIGLLALDRLLTWIGDMRTRQLRIGKILPEILVFALPTFAWLIFAAIYFGTPIPHSIAAKSLAYHLSPEAGFVRLLQHYATPFLDHLTFGIPWIGVGLVLYPFLYILGACSSLSSQKHIWPLAAYPWLYFAAYALANPLIFRWYMTPPLPAFILFILGGAEVLIAKITDAAKRQESPGEQPKVYGFWPHLLMLIFVVFAPFILSLRDWKLHPSHGLDRPAPEMAWYQLELLYRQAAEEIVSEPLETGIPIRTLAAGDVGVLGFFTGMRILDTVGLNSPLATSYYPLDPSFYAINYAIPPQLILDSRPDVIVILEIYGRNGLLKDPAFWQLYRLRKVIPTDIYGSDGMLILELTEP
jgi:hypothetical protein